MQHKRQFMRLWTIGSWVTALGCIVAVAVYAMGDEQLIHVFPTSVAGEGWIKTPQALEQQLSGSALLEDFSVANSAVIRFAADGTDARTGGAPVGTESGRGMGTSAEETPEGEASSTDASTDTVPADAAGDALDEAAAPADGASESEDPTDSVGADANPSVDDVAPSTSAASPHVPLADATPLSYGAAVVRSLIAPPALAAAGVSADDFGDQGSWGSSTAAVGALATPASSAVDEAGDDVRVCSVLGTSCNTVTFNGFDIGSVLSDHAVIGYTLRLSLAARVEGESVAADKLVVRYFAFGRWHLAGEVALDHSRSNYDDGGHLAFLLPDLVSWDALRDFSVEVEYVRQGTAETEAFLDSAWVDVVYEASADESAPEASNIMTELAVLEDSLRPDLLVSGEQRVELTNMDAAQGDLVVRSDRAVYDGLTAARAYVAVTNTTDHDDTVTLTVHLDPSAAVTRMAERVKRVPRGNAVPTFREVAYFCEGGWREGVERGGVGAGESGVGSDEASPVGSEPDDGEAPLPEGSATDGSLAATPTAAVASDDASSSSPLPPTPHPLPSTFPTYTCALTGEVEACTSFNDDETNCIVGNERVSVEEGVRYEDAWREVALEDVSGEEREGPGILARLLGSTTTTPVSPLARTQRTADVISLAPHETRYLELDLSFPVQRAGELLLTIEGDEANAEQRLWWRSGFTHRAPVTLVPHADPASGVPTLYEIELGREAADLFSVARSDGSDVYFYDPVTRRELPVKELAYRYVDQYAHYAIEFAEPIGSSTRELYAYVGNAHVPVSDRAAAPSLTPEPIEYVGFTGVENGAVVTVESARSGNAIHTMDAGEDEQLDLGERRDVFLADSEARIAARGPLIVSLADSEELARTLTVAARTDLHTSMVPAPRGAREQYLVERYHLASSTVTIGALEELPLPAIGVLATHELPQNGTQYVRHLREPQFHAFREALRDFELGEQPEFSLSYHPQKSAVRRFLQGLFRDHLTTLGQVRLLRAGEPVPDVRFAATTTAEGAWTVRMVEAPRTIAPGTYTLELTVDELGTPRTDSFDFYWGVLAINTPQATYAPGSDVELDIAALDDRGDTICDAELRLTVADPAGALFEVPVEPQDTCANNNVTDESDYRAHYRPTDQGTYNVTVTHVNAAGEVVHRVTDAFDVRESVPYVIRRSGATRIWPRASYVMTLELTATEDVRGQLVEAVPGDFSLLDTGGAATDSWGNATRLIWDLDLLAGETQTVSYVYDAPDISPRLYLLGPAEVRTGNGSPFVEGRQWQLASDAAGSMLLYWDGTTIPTGWTCVSCISGDPFYQRFIMGSSSAGTNGGAATHTHTLNGAVGAESAAATGGNGGNAVATAAHTHTYAPAAPSSESNLPPYRQLVVIQYNSAGDPPSIPAGAIGMFDIASSSLPAGWNRYTPEDGYFIRSESTSTVGTAAGSSTHAHNLPSGTTANFNGSINRANGATVGGASPHEHSVPAASSSYVSIVPPYREALLAKLAATSTPPNDLIAAWSDTPPANYTTVSSSSEPFADRFVRASTTYGDSGGATTHTHVNVVVTSGTQSAQVTRGAGGQSGNHTHQVTLSFSTDAHLPPYRTAIFGKRNSGSPPSGATLHDIPFDNERTGSSSPVFEFTADDPDGVESLTYEFSWSSDPTFTASTTRSSADESGCSPNCFQNLASPGDFSPFNDNERIRFSIQSTLTTGTTYYWRVRSKDGGASFGAWTAARSFTYVAGTNPSQWFQSEDAQFDTGVLTSTETFGDGAVRISTAPPSGAMIAYGEDVQQVPRYRIWTGSSWGSEQTDAQNVGGTINWTVLKAATTRNEYVLGTQDTGADVNVQVYQSGAWTDLLELTQTVANADYRGFDIAYETQSGRAMVVYCDGDSDPSYRTYDGSDWSSPGTVDLGFSQNCEWVKLASDPTSNEIILVARANVAQAGTDYEVQVWDGVSTWGNTLTLGAGDEGQNEGIAVAYEESGNQAVVVVSNGTNNNFTYNSWDGEGWGAGGTRSLGDDFETGELAADDGSDTLILCYDDEDHHLGIATWDGTANTWDSWSGRPSVDEFETAAENGTAVADNHGRPVSCQFETTAGRDGYLMAPYSDQTNARYQYWDGAAWSGEQSLPATPIQDAWTIGSVRTGDGKVLAILYDDVNTQYDATDWNGSSWTALNTLETTPSRATEPYLEPMMLAAQRYQATQGTIVSPVVDFDVVPSRSSWGEAIWNTTEPQGTDVLVQVMWAAAASTTCTAFVPDGALAGNSAGFAATSSPLNLSGLSTSTYNRLCLKATLSSNTSNSPTLNDWTVSWQRQPFLTQASYRWYANTDGLTPSDAWPTGANDVLEDEAIGEAYAPGIGSVLRLRLGIEDSNVALSASETSLRLEWAEGSPCSDSLTWQSVGTSGSSVVWRGYDNAAVADGVAIGSRLLAATDVSESYEEENDSVVNPGGIPIGDEGEWDFVLQHQATSSTNYCFRAVKADGTTLGGYSVYPQLVTNSAPGTPTLVTPFPFEALASTSPWFTFVSADPKGDDIHYAVEVDDDPLFGSPALARNSEDNFAEFTNMITPADKSPFNSGETVRFIPASALSDNTTYWWRVRARDPAGSNDWSAWSDTQSFTASSTVVISTWHQSTMDQFLLDEHEQTEATSTNDIVLTPPNTSGTATSPTIDFDWHTSGNAWGALSWTDNEATGDIRYHIEYYSSSGWTLVPDSVLAGNAAGFGSGAPISLLALDPTTYNELRLRSNFTYIGGSPRLNDWTLSWGLAVEQPTLLSPFDNEKVGTTTPSFTFYSSDPESQDLQYEFQWSTTSAFTNATTSTSTATNGAFVNTASSTDLSPFFSGNTLRFTATSGSAMLQNGTYWWRVRARDPSGGNTWSVWSPTRSFTVDSAVTVSTWFQTTDEQWETDTLTDTEVYGAHSVRVTSIIREAMTIYAEGNIQTPRYRIWNGQQWGSEKSAVNIGERVDWVRMAAAPTRNEYLLATQGSSGAVKAQVYTGSTTNFADLTATLATASNAAYRAFDVAYESTSGDGIVVACNGQDAAYQTRSASGWSASNPINLSVAQNCEWVQLTSDPTSDEIILLVRFNTAGTVDYEAQVWDGGTWGNSTTLGNAGAVTDEGMAALYEESGTDAVIVASNGTNNNFASKRWNGSWQATTTTAIGNDFNKAAMCRDLGTDRLTVVYTDEDTDMGYAEWDGTTNSWGASTELEVDGVNEINNEIACTYETTSGRDGYVLFTYGDGIVTTEQYRVLDRSTPVTIAQNISTLGEAYSAFTARTGDGTILGLFYDDDADDYFFSGWDGSQWSVAQQLESDGNTQNPRREPLAIAARRYPSFTAGSVVSDPIIFTDGTGPRWGVASSTDTTPGSSSISYQFEYSADGGDTWSLIPDAVLPGNSTGTTSNSIDLSNVSYATYGTIRYVANFTCVSGDCPTLQDWTVAWSEGITVSGTAKAYDETTDVTSGTVMVAVNSTLQSGKQGTISGGTWSIPNVTLFPGDVVTVFIDGANDANEAAAVTRYDGYGNMTGVELFERHLTIGSPDATTTTNADIARYDYSTSSDEDLFFDVDAGNDLYVCAPASGNCFDAKLLVATTSTYRPDSANSGTLYAHDVVVQGTTTADSNTFYVSGSWRVSGRFDSGNGTVVMTATSSSENIDSTGASAYAFNTLTLGQSNSATWTAQSLLDVNGAMTLAYGTFVASTSNLFLGGDLSLQMGTTFVKGAGTTTFDGATVAVMTDATVVKQNLGKVAINGSSKTVRLGSAATTTDLWIETSNTFDVSSNNYALELTGDLHNHGSFSARSGTVTFTATTTGRVINPGSSPFYNLSLNGAGGTWAFEDADVTISNNLTIATGTLTLATGTTTLSGALTNTGGAFVHNNGTLELTGSGAKTLTQNGSALYNITTNGAGSWSWTDTNATTSGTVRLLNGTLTFPTGTLTIGKSLLNIGGSIQANGGTTRYTSASSETIRTNGSGLFGVTVDGAGGTFTLSDTNLVASGTVQLLAGTTTFPTGTFTIGGSFTGVGGTWSANGGAVLFNSTATGRTVNPGSGVFNAVTFSSGTGGWTVTGNATSTGSFTLASAQSFTAQSGVTIEVDGTFTNSIPASTTWTGSTLFLNSGTSYTVGSKTQAAEGYGTLKVGANTDIRTWQSSSTAYVVDSTGSLVSQDHAAVDGDFYIYGTYERASGTEYWSYATDFDGAALGGGSRQVDVRFASGASAAFTGATLQVLGNASASTTVANQGSGSYALSVHDGTVQAQHYTMTDLAADGFSILGSSTVSSLSDGAYLLTTDGGTMLTVSSTTIDANPALQIFRVAFGTSSGVSSGYNVTASGTASSYWSFRDHSGNYDGEEYDNDPVVGAGSIRWDDSGFTISIDGTVFVGEGSGGAPAACNGSTQILRLVVNGSTQYNAACAAGSGTFTFPAVTYTGDVPLILYINDSVGTRGAVVSRSPQSNIAGFNLYQNRVIVRHEGVDAATIATMLPYDSDQDPDIPFDAEVGTLTVEPETGFYLWQGKSFAPGGNVTLTPGGSGAVYDGSLRLAAGSTFTAAGSEAHSIGGSFIAEAGATFAAANSTVSFTATSSGKTVAPSSNFYNASFTGSGGWTIASSTTVANDLTVAAGTISGTQDITVQNGALSGNGTVTMTGGTVSVGKGGTFGGNSPWTFSSLSLGDGSANTTAKSGSGDILVTGALSIAASHVLNAGSVVWTFSGSGAVLSVAGTFTPENSTTTFAGTGAMTVPALTYRALVLAPSGAGSPTYTLSSGALTTYTLTVGDGSHPVTVDVTASDPLLTATGTVRIMQSATYSASNSNDLQIGGSYVNQGTFTSNGGGVLFNSLDTGETVDPGGSSFHHVTFNSAGGGWTMLTSATSTGNFSLTSGTYTQDPGTVLTVQGIFTNGIGGAATTWSNTTLSLTSGTSYSMNTKSAGGDVYSTLSVGANTDIKMWNSTSSSYAVAASGSLVSQDHNAVDGALSIWGDYERLSGSEYWSYATDFDGTDISGSPRTVAVRLAPNATTTLSGGSWNITGAAGATTTIATQGGGTYALRITGGTFSAQYYRIRDINATGLEFSGSPTVTQLSDGDLELAINGGAMLTVPASVISANPAKTWYRISFATSSGITSGRNATSSGSTASLWRFTPALGNYYGEAYDGDPAGDPGYFVWDDSNAQVTIAGKVYSGEGSGVSTICNGSSPVVRMVIQGGSGQSASCAAGTGDYAFTGVTYSPGDSIMVYIDGTSTQAANVTIDPLTSISDFDLYERRVIVRHEDTSPITIDDLAIYDSSDDADIPFTAVSSSPDTLTLPANHKLLVWAGKTFTPGGDVTLTSGGTGTSYDGTLELQAGATYVSSAAIPESIAVGGSWLTGVGAVFTAGSSTVTFTATTSGKTVSPKASPFYNLVFNGSGGVWTFADRDATTTRSFTISAGSVTLGTSTLAVGGSFVNSATMSAASTSITFSSSSAATATFGGYAVGSLSFAGGGAYTMTDTDATSTGSVSITAGSVALPSGTFAVANGFSAQGGTFSHAGTLRLYGSLAAQTLRFGTSQVRHLTVAGPGSWAFADTNATTTGTTTIATGGLTAPSGGFGIGGSFINQATFNANGGQVNFFATTTGQTISASSTVFANVLISGIGGGWTFATSASTTGSFRLIAASSFAMAASTTLEVRGAFENLVGGASTTFATSTLLLNSGTSYTVNTKSAGGDSYAYLTLGQNTDVRMWDSAAATTTVATSGSLYSMDHAGTPGNLYLWGDYVQASGADYWSYATDFDGAALGGSSRQVDVRIASSSALSFTGGTLEVVGAAGATTSVAVMGSGAYSLAKSGGTLNMQYYQFKNLDSAGIVLSGALSITSLSYGDLELSKQGGVLLQVASTTIDQNPSKSIAGMRFATTSGVTGTNVQRNGTTANFWDFNAHYGEIDGEAYDSDGVDACGAIRWDDSTCLEVSQAHYRFRNDDGGGGAPDSEWYDQNWNKRKRVNVTNPNGSVLTNTAVRFDIGYDGDMQSDWDDIRFTDSSGTTSLPYFVERYTTNATATVWVKVPSLPANGSTFIYAYYSNAFATNGESGANTFTFFDDFEDDNLSEYSGDTGYFDAVSNSGAEGSYILEAAAGYENNQTPDGIYRTGTTFGQGSTVRWMQYVTASQDDEPCTLFGVQTPGTNNQNYAVCFDQYPSDKLILARNVSSNDASGSVLASSTVSWATGWYTTEVDWLTDNTIYVSVYNSSGTLFATTSTSSSTYTSGGMGFSFWYQHDGWDFYTVRPYVATEPSTSIGPEQGKGGATWKAAQDTAITQDQGQTFRARFSVENSGPQITGQEWRLQYADKTGYGTCNAVPSVEFDDVPAQAGCGVNPICLTTTSQYADGDPTQELLTSTTFYPSVEGYLVESPSNQTPSMTLDQNRVTEVEYTIELTENAVSNAYCMRVSDGGLELDSYQTIAEVTANYGPQINAWTFNESTLTNPNPIALVEGDTTVVVATGTVTDLNGFEDLLYATSTFYRSGVGAGCSSDLNNCYQINSLECPLDNCSGNSCEVTCTADLQYFAEPTDEGSAHAAEQWEAKLYVVDMTNNEASSTADGAELLTLWGVGLTTGAVSYGSLELGQDTGAYNATTTLKNTGNDGIDIELEGTAMTNGASSIPAANQKYATTTFTYASCVICSALSGTASTFEMDLPKPTSTTTPVTDDLYWGVYVPMGVSGVTHNGQTTFYATGD